MLKARHSAKNCKNRAFVKTNAIPKEYVNTLRKFWFLYNQSMDITLGTKQSIFLQTVFLFYRECIMLTDIGKGAYLLHMCLLGIVCQQTALFDQAGGITYKESIVGNLAL